jgi:hypothetical protein
VRKERALLLYAAIYGVHSKRLIDYQLSEPRYRQRIKNASLSPHLAVMWKFLNSDFKFPH